MSSGLYDRIEEAKKKSKALADKLGVEFNPEEPPKIEDVEIRTNAWIALQSNKEKIQEIIDDVNKRHDK